MVTRKEKVLAVKFPCVVEGCRHGYFRDDEKFLDHMIRDHFIIDEVSEAAPSSIHGPSQLDPSPSELSPSFSSECIDIAPIIESHSFCCQNKFALAVDVDNTCRCICASCSGADHGKYNAFALTTAHNDCSPGSYLVTLTQFILLCVSIICIVYVSLLLLCGDRVKPRSN